MQMDHYFIVGGIEQDYVAKENIIQITYQETGVPSIVQDVVSRLINCGAAISVTWAMARGRVLHTQDREM